MLKSLLFCAIGSLIYTPGVGAVNQQPGPSLKLIQQINTYFGMNREEIILDMNRPDYLPGDTVWFKAYVLEKASLRPSFKSNILHAALLNNRGTVLRSLILRYDANNFCGYLPLSGNLVRGTYYLVAYTNWMKNFPGNDYALKSILVRDQAAGSPPSDTVHQPPATKARIQFYPETGHIIGDYPDIIAFRAWDSAGNSLNINGYVKDNLGADVTDFKSGPHGLGSFPLPATVKKRFIAYTNLPDGSQQVDTLPATDPYSYIIHIGSVSAGFIHALVIPGDSLYKTGVQSIILALSKGRVCFAAVGKDAFAVNIPTKDFGPGITQISLFNMKGEPVAERLVYIPAPALIQITPTVRGSTAPQELSLQVSAHQSTGEPLAGSFSVIARNNSSIAGNGWPDPIFSHLLLDQGSGEAGNLTENSPKQVNPLSSDEMDLLMIEQQWQGPSWDEILNQPPPQIIYKPELSQTIGGTVHNAEGEPLAHRSISLITKGQGIFSMDTTDATGHFLFKGLALKDSLITLLSLNLDKKDRDEKITMLVDSSTDFALPADFHLPGGPGSDNHQKYSLANRTNPSEKAVQLDTAEVRTRPANTNRAHASNVINSDELLKFNDPFEALTLVPGVEVLNLNGQSQVMIHGYSSFSLNSNPLLVIDDEEFDNLQELSTVQPADIDSIVILKDAAIYGARGANGAILVYMKKSGNTEQRNVNNDIKTFRFQGYENPTANAHVSTDRSGYLYWNGNVFTDSTGQAEVLINPSPGLGNLQVILQGITDSGIPVYREVALKPSGQ